MASSKDIEIRLYRRVAEARLEDASFLFEHGRNSASMYLAGYVVECALESLLLSVIPLNKRQETALSFRGSWAHDYDSLITRYRRSGGIVFPKNIQRALYIVKEWTTDMRYNPRQIKLKDAKDFLIATHSIYSWMEGRM